MLWKCSTLKVSKELGVNLMEMAGAIYTCMKGAMDVCQFTLTEPARSSPDFLSTEEPIAFW